MAVAIAESCFSSLNREAAGAEIELENDGLSTEAQLFSESPSRIVISFAPDKLAEVEAIAKSANCPFEVIGKVTGEKLSIDINGEVIISSAISELGSIWSNSLERRLEN